ncbi:MAG: sigma factor [Akkermansiaceae bacterium]
MSQGLNPQFVKLLTNNQSALYAFIVSRMGSVDQANDVLQEANLKLCKKADEFDSERPFLAWAFTFARFEVMAWRKKQQRSRLARLSPTYLFRPPRQTVSHLPAQCCTRWHRGLRPQIRRARLAC